MINSFLPDRRFERGELGLDTGRQRGDGGPVERRTTQPSHAFLPLTGLTANDLDAWRELADIAVEPNPFFDPDFVLPAAAALAESEDVHLLVVKSGTTWIGCVPMRRYRRWHRVPLSCVATWRHAYCLLGTPLVAPGHEQEAVATLVAALVGMRSSTLSALDWVSSRGCLQEALAEALPSRALVFEDFQRATVQRRPEDDYLEGWLKSKDRREFRRRSRLLGEELGGEPTLVDRSGDEAAVEDFLAMECAGWKGEARTALASDPAHARFFRDTLAGFARRGALNLIFLEVAGVKVAGTCDLVAGDTDFCFKVAYDESLGRFAPGRDLSLKMIDHFHADTRLRLMDSCSDPRNEAYNRIWGDRRTVQTLAFGGTGSLGLPSLRAAMAVRDRRRRRAAAAA